MDFTTSTVLKFIEEGEVPCHRSLSRALDEGEKKLVQEKGIRVHTMHDIDRSGMAQADAPGVGILDEKNRTAIAASALMGSLLGDQLV